MPSSLWLLAACATPSQVDLDVGAAAGGAYEVVVARDDGSIALVLCPGGAGDRLTCTDAGARIDAPSGDLEVTLRARGMAFRSETLALRDLPRDGVLDFAPTALAPFERTDDYATGFAADGLEDFRSLSYPSDTELGPSHLVKFLITGWQGTPQVYFQDTQKHPLHYDFAREVLGVPLTSTEFEAQTYRGLDRAFVAGTLVLYDTVRADSVALGETLEAPVALTFFPSDDLTPDQAQRTQDLLEERMGFAPLVGGGPQRVAWLPAGSLQEQALGQDPGVFDRRGSAWVLRDELWGNTTLQILNEGEAWGTLRRLTPEDLETTVVSYTDVLVLTCLPNDLPIVGGTITEEFQTPLAHVNVAAISRGTPNVAWLDAGQDPTVMDLLGQTVHLQVADGEVLLEAATEEEARAFWESRGVEPVTLEADLSVTGLPAFDDLGFHDAVSVGVKAANLAELHHLLGDASPDGFAVPFSAYDTFLSQATVDPDLCAGAAEDCVDEERDPDLCDRVQALCAQSSSPETLRAYTDRLLATDEFLSDSLLREAALDGVRWLIRNIAVDETFARELDDRFASTFGGQDARIRSSTNAEDLEDFSGAGLYDSTTVDASEVPSEEIRKVWASVWNWSAFEERSWWGIDPRSVWMGVAVHPSYGEEEANGVLITQNIADPMVSGMYVNVQVGEVSVTNPEDGSLPEVFSILPGTEPGQVQVARSSWSSLSPGVPILDDEEVARLHSLASQVQEHFAPLYGESPENLALDLEFKLEEGTRDLSVKQVRPFAGY